MEAKIRSRFLNLFTSINSYRYSKDLAAKFPELDFAPEIKSGFHHYISKMNVAYLDNALLIYEDNR
jgi:hypothetical protein